MGEDDVSPSKIVGMLILAGLFLFVIIRFFHMQRNVIEGLANINTNKMSGEAGGSETYQSALKNNVINVQDRLLISKYKSQYENILISLDDYASNLAMEKILNMSQTDPNTFVSQCTDINSLTNFRNSLNVAMDFLNKQK